jgi:hypothetical protein
MTSYLMDDMLFNSAMSILNTAVVLSQPENENENDGDGHSIASNVSSIETVRALSEVLELEENASLCRSSESITVEEQVSLSLGDHAEKKEHFETDSNGSVLPTVEEIANKIQDALAEPIHQDQKEEATMDNDKSESWSLLADECYGPLGRLQLQRQLLEEESRWNRIHQQPDLLEKLKHNGFVLELLNKYSCPLKVSNLPYVTRYKCLQNHFFNPSVLVCISM